MDLNRRVQLFESWRNRQFPSRLVAGALAGAGLLGTVWCLTSTAAGGARMVLRQPPARVASAPVGFGDITQMLDDADPAARLEAIKYIEVLPRPAGELVPLLARRFDDADLVVRVQAVHAAMRVGMPVEQAIPLARQLLVPNNPRVCCMASQVLGLAGPSARDALPQLRACLTAQSLWVPLHAARAAVRIDAHEADAIGVLRRAICENDPGEVYEFAARALDEAALKLAQDLQCDDAEVRRTATITLEQFRSSAAAATPALVGSFADADPLVRVHAARAAFRAAVPARQVIPVVSGLLVPEQPEVLREATSILVEIGPDGRDALPKLHECLTSPSIAVRLHAAEAALRIDPQDRQALAELHAALGDRRGDVRFFAVNSLGPAVPENDRAAYILFGAMADANPQVAVAAALQLARTPDQAGDDARQNLAIEAEYRESASVDEAAWIFKLSRGSDDARRAAAIHLALAGPEARAALPVLMDRLSDPNLAVRLAVAHAVWEIDGNGELVLPVLVDLLTAGQSEIRIGAEYALGRMEGAAADAVPELARMLKGCHSIERLSLAASLVRIDPDHDAAFSLLLGGLQSADNDVRYLSTVALGAMPLSRQLTIEEALGAVIQDGNARIRYAAYESMSQLLVRRAVAQAAQAAAADLAGDSNQ
jgi:hypothetical protein